MKLFRFLAYSFAFFLGAVFAFRGTNTFPAPPPKQYMPRYVINPPTTAGDVTGVPQFDDQAQLGRTLFVSNCAACHNRNMVDDLTGPALGGVRERWASYPKEDLYEWIRSSQAMIETGHPRAIALWSEWKPVLMNNFPDLSNQEIDAILAYADAVYTNW